MATHIIKYDLASNFNPYIQQNIDKIAKDIADHSKLYPTEYVDYEKTEYDGKNINIYVSHQLAIQDDMNIDVLRVIGNFARGDPQSPMSYWISNYIDYEIAKSIVNNLDTNTINTVINAVIPIHIIGFYVYGITSKITTIEEMLTNDDIYIQITGAKNNIISAFSNQYYNNPTSDMCAKYISGSLAASAAYFSNVLNTFPLIIAGSKDIAVNATLIDKISKQITDAMLQRQLTCDTALMSSDTMKKAIDQDIYSRFNLAYMANDIYPHKCPDECLICKPGTNQCLITKPVGFLIGLGALAALYFSLNPSPRHELEKTIEERKRPGPSPVPLQERMAKSAIQRGKLVRRRR